MAAKKKTPSPKPDRSRTPSRARTRGGQAVRKRKPEPKPRAPIHPKPEPLWVRPFLEALAATWNVAGSISILKEKGISISRATVYERRDAHPDFAAEWDDAWKDGGDTMRAEARRRAIEGVLEPVFYKGELVGVVRKYSDQLLIKMLAAAFPSEFKDRVEHSGTAPDGSLSISLVDRIVRDGDGAG